MNVDTELCCDVKPPWPVNSGLKRILNVSLLPVKKRVRLQIRRREMARRDGNGEGKLIRVRGQNELRGSRGRGRLSSLGPSEEVRSNCEAVALGHEARLAILPRHEASPLEDQVDGAILDGLAGHQNNLASNHTSWVKHALPIRNFHL